MSRLSNRTIASVEPQAKDYFLWDDDLPGFGLRVFPTGKRSFLVQYRAGGRTRRYTIGPHGVWTPEAARKQAQVLLAEIAHGENPAEQRLLDIKAITVKELCERYLQDADSGLIQGKGRRPKKASTLVCDKSRINRHIVPLLGTRRVRDVTSSEVTQFLRDVARGKTKLDVKTKRRGRSIVRGGIGAATRTVSLLGGIFTYALQLGIIDRNPVHGVRKFADQKKSRRLSEGEYRLLGEILRKAVEKEQHQTPVDMIRAIACTGCRLGEIVTLKWADIDAENSCIRFGDTKEGASTRPIGLPVMDFFDRLRPNRLGIYVFPGTQSGKPLIGFPKYWIAILKDTELSSITPHVLRHSFASIANDLGLTEVTIAALLGHSRGTITSRYIHTVDSALIMAADTVAGYIQGLLDGVEFKRNSYAFDRASRQAVLDRLFDQPKKGQTNEDRLPVEPGAA
jgi:integrase